MTLEEMERELGQAETRAWREADILQESSPGDALHKAELASLLYAAATLLRRAIAVEADQPVAA